jgi:hypothetical protein
MNNPAISTTVDNDPPPSSRTSRTILTQLFSIGSLLMRYLSCISTVFIFKINVEFWQINDTILNPFLFTILDLARFLNFNDVSNDRNNFNYHLLLTVRRTSEPWSFNFLHIIRRIQLHQLLLLP